MRTSGQGPGIFELYVRMIRKHNLIQFERSQTFIAGKKIALGRENHRRRRGSPRLSRDFVGVTGRMRELRPYLPIDVFAWFDGEHVQPLGTDTAVENAIGPDPVGPDLVLLKVTFQRLAVEEVFGKVTERFFDSLLLGFVTILEIFEGLRCETDLPHCSSPNTALKE